MASKQEILDRLLPVLNMTERGKDVWQLRYIHDSHGKYVLVSVNGGTSFIVSVKGDKLAMVANVISAVNERRAKW